jgi:hypothetical protein
MKNYTLPPIWDAKKFADRYGLDKDRDFYINASGQLIVFPVLPNDPPIFEATDPLLPTITSLINETPMPLKTILLRLAEGK